MTPNEEVRESALEKALRLHQSRLMNNHMGYTKPDADSVVQDAETFRKFLTGETE